MHICLNQFSKTDTKFIAHLSFNHYDTCALVLRDSTLYESTRIDKAQSINSFSLYPCTTYMHLNLHDGRSHSLLLAVAFESLFLRLLTIYDQINNLCVNISFTSCVIRIILVHRIFRSIIGMSRVLRCAYIWFIAVNVKNFSCWSASFKLLQSTMEHESDGQCSLKLWEYLIFFLLHNHIIRDLFFFSFSLM